MRRIFGGTDAQEEDFSNGSHSSNSSSAPFGFSSASSTSTAGTALKDPPPPKPWYALQNGSSWTPTATGLFKTASIRNTLSSFRRQQSSTMDLDDPRSLPFGTSRVKDDGDTLNFTQYLNGDTSRFPHFSNGGTLPSEVVDGKHSGASLDFEQRQDAFMFDLLSTQAIVEAKNWEILSWDDMERSKKLQIDLDSQLASLDRAYSLETKMLNASQKLLRFTPMSTPSYTKTSQSIATSEKTLAALELQRETIKAILGDVEAKLSRHWAAVLSRARKKEQPTSPVASDTTIQMVPDPGQAEKVKTLESRISELESLLDSKSQAASDSESRLMQEINDMNLQVSKLRSTLSEKDSHLENVQQDLFLLQKLHGTLKSELEEASVTRERGQTDLVDSKRQLESLKQELEESKAVAIDPDTFAALNHEVEWLRTEKESASEQLSRLKQSASSDENELRKRINDLTEEEQRLNTLLAASEEEKSKILEAVGDSLNKLKQDSTLEDALAGVAGFDQEEASESDTVEYVSSILRLFNSTILSFVRTTVGHLEDSREAHEGVRSEMNNAMEEWEKLRMTVEGHLKEKEEMEEDIEILKAKLQKYNETQKELEGVRGQVDKAKDERESFERKIETLDSAKTEAEHTLAKTLKSLQEIWKSLPPVEARSKASNSEDLGSMKSVLEVPRKINFLANQGKFTVEALGERMRSLLEEDVKIVNKLIGMEKDVGRNNKALQKEWEKKLEDSTKDWEKKLELSTKDWESKLNKNAREWETKLDTQVKEREEATKKAKDLEIHLEANSTQQVTMLERLNDLTQNLESARGERRQLETKLSLVQIELAEAKSSSIEMQRSNSNQSIAAEADKVRIRELEGKIRRLEEEIEDLQREVSDGKKKEQKARAAFILQIEEVESENSTLKAQLRQEKRNRAQG